MLAAATANPGTPTGAHAGRAGAGFEALDDLVARPGAVGFVEVRAERAAIWALARHCGRRAQQVGRACLVVGGANPWRQLTLLLGVSCTDEPAVVADAVAAAAAGAVLFVSLAQDSAWGRTMADEFVKRALEPDRTLLLVVASEPSLRDNVPPKLIAPRPANHHVVDLGEIGALGMDRWWQAVIATDPFFSEPHATELTALDGWWESARSVSLGACGGQRAVGVRLSRLEPAARRLLGEALAVEIPLSASELTLLGGRDACDALLASGLVSDVAGGRYVPDPSADMAVELDGESSARVLELLASRRRRDGWTTMRMAELTAAVGDRDAAERLAFDALGATHEPRAREDLWQRWDGVLMSLADDSSSDAALGALVRSAERALALGDGDRADALASRASRLGGEGYDVLLLRGRTCRARGDLTTATLVLLRATAVAPGAPARAEALAALAETRYAAGDLREAHRLADESLTLSADARVRLVARNVLGKLYLADAAWEAAERHFAEDAYEAARAGLREGELRARLNRAIAVMQAGRRADARLSLEEILGEAEGEGAQRAVAYALANLATIAIHELDMPRALELSERAIALRHQIGERTSLARPITNLAELRLRLGLGAEAEQALRFGLQICGSTLPVAQHAYFALVAARIHLSRAASADAAREVATARAGAAAGGDHDLQAECDRVAARIALHDGDVGRAEVAIAAAATAAHTPAARAEVALLEASLARALGRPFEAKAREAQALAVRARECEFAREALELCAVAHREAGNEAAFRRAVLGAVAERDRLAARLPSALCERYLARPELGTLSCLEVELSNVSCASPAVELRRPPPSTERTQRRRELVGQSPAMTHMRRTIQRVAPSEASVLVLGPTGSGKELVAEAIHAGSRRRGGPLVKVHCAALVETLLLSELFGHERGAFTGAAARKRGRFELADGGTVFLDEIGDISPRTQVALLRVLQDGIFERVGGTAPVRVDVRVVAATHRDLANMVQRGEFREDLYYRLCGVAVEVPSLADRIGDLPLLCEVILEDAARDGLPRRRLGRDALAALSRHAWPGNVRELENCLRAVALFAVGGEISEDDVCEHVTSLRTSADAPPSAPRSISTRGPASVPPPSSSEIVYSEVRGGTGLAAMKRRLERDCIARALADAGGNITRAAELLGMKRPRLSQLVKQYKLALPEDSQS